MVPFPFSAEPPPTGAELDPLARDALDEAVSAWLDDELDALAAEYGADPAAVRERLLAWPGFSDRAARLRTAGAALAATTPAPLEPADRDRLLAGVHAAVAAPVPALAVRRHERRVRLTALIGAAAAAVVVAIVGLTFLTQPETSRVAKADRSSAAGDAAGGGSGAETESVSPTTSTVDAPASTYPADSTTGAADLGDVGPLDDPAARDELAASGTDQQAMRSSDGAPATGGAPAPTAGSAPACAAAVLGAVPEASAIMGIGTGTFAGQPAAWYLVATPEREVGVVVDPVSCAVLARTA